MKRCCWLLFLCALAAACGETRSDVSVQAAAPAGPPPAVAACTGNDCFAYDFTSGDTCTACAAPGCESPAWEVITWLEAIPTAAPALESLGYDCYDGDSRTVCYLDHDCPAPPDQPASFSSICENSLTQAPTPAPFACESMSAGAKVYVQPRSNLGFWPSGRTATRFVDGTTVTVAAVVWLPVGVSLEVGLDCGQDPQLTDRQGQSSSRIRGAGRWEIARQSFWFDNDHPFCVGWGQILNAAEAPPDDGVGAGVSAYMGSYSISGQGSP